MVKTFQFELGTFYLTPGKDNLQEYSERIRKHYLALLDRYGPTFRAVDWGSREGQATRFRVLLEVEGIRDASILDVGCGIGHMVEHLVEIGFSGDYVGIDVLPEMIACARKRYPEWKFEEANILDMRMTWNTEYVVSSGIFTLSSRSLMKRIVKAMFGVCRKAVAFNSLSTWAGCKEPGEFYADPLDTLEFCRTLTPWVVLRHDYIPHDFTIVMYKEAIRR